MLSRRLLRIKVLKALYAHMKSESDNATASEKNLMLSVDKTYDLYVHLFGLVVEVARYAEERQEIALQKKLPTYEDLHPNRRFVDNSVVRLLADSTVINDFTSKRKLSWSGERELIKTLYNQLIEADYFKEYMNAAECDFKDDLRLVEAFFTNEPEECEPLEEVLEEQSVMWRDDLGFALLMVLRTLSNLRRSSTDVRLLPEFKNEDDPQFARTLFRQTLASYEECQSIVGEYVENWELDRIAFMDGLIMAMAMTELRTFPSIPVKVTLDEYIEISKFYSTPGSAQFINGILDKAVERFAADGSMSKSGTGLI